jgi:dienelactone hydrolase
MDMWLGSRAVRARTRELVGFDRATFAHDGRRHDVYRAGSGPAVVVIHELPGIHPGVVELGRRLVAAGYTVFLPSLFGRPGEPLAAAATLRAIVRVCVAREFAILADRTSPVATWLRALAAEAHGECGGPGVGAIGMCFTGGFALAMAVEPAVLAPVLSQPGLPAPITARKRAAVGLDDADLARVKRRAEDGMGVLGLRFTADKGCPSARFQTLRRELGERFEGIEIDSSPGNPYRIPARAHAVLTVDLADEPGHPTRAALDRVMAFLAERLLAGD